MVCEVSSESELDVLEANLFLLLLSSSSVLQPICSGKTSLHYAWSHLVQGIYALRHRRLTFLPKYNVLIKVHWQYGLERISLSAVLQIWA